MTSGEGLSRSGPEVFKDGRLKRNHLGSPTDKIQKSSLTPISHKLVERNGGESVRRLVITEPYESTPRRHSEDRL
jgi:hypothetical protein